MEKQVWPANTTHDKIGVETRVHFLLRHTDTLSGEEESVVSQGIHVQIE